ncbi:hypothetical protein ACHQM5_012482 [Ranunculus cassubicifolius]
MRRIAAICILFLVISSTAALEFHDCCEMFSHDPCDPDNLDDNKSCDDLCQNGGCSNGGKCQLSYPDNLPLCFCKCRP